MRERVHEVVHAPDDRQLPRPRREPHLRRSCRQEELQDADQRYGDYGEDQGLVEKTVAVHMVLKITRVIGGLGGVEKSRQASSLQPATFVELLSDSTLQRACLSVLPLLIHQTDHTTLNLLIDEIIYS